MARAMVVAALIMTGAVYASDVNFHPEVILWGEYSDNIAVSPGGQEMGDVTTRLEIVLPVVKNWDSGSLLFSYAPRIERYQDASYLDNDAHRLLFSVDDTPNRRSTFHMDLGFRRFLDQGRSRDILNDDLFLIQPAQRDRVNGAISFARQFGRRWEWTGVLDGVDSSFAAIDGGVSAEVPEDRTEYGATLSLDFMNSAQSTFGVLVRHRSNDLEVSGSEDLQQLGLAWSRVLGRATDIKLEAGGSDRSGEYIFVGQVLPEQVTETTLFGSIELNRAMRKSQLQLVAAHNPSSGGTLRGTSTDSLVSLGLVGTPGRNWGWMFAARYASRDALDPSLGVTDSVGAGGEIEWRPTRLTGLRLGFDYVDQSSDAAVEDRTLGRAWLGFVWYPRGQAGATLEEEEE